MRRYKAKVDANETGVSFVCKDAPSTGLRWLSLNRSAQWNRVLSRWRL
jgi:hypothetical protein